MNIYSFPLFPWFIILLVVVSGFASYISGKLTMTAAVAGVMIALVIYLGTGLPALIMLAAFFVLGTAVTSYKKEFKVKMRLAEENEGKRKWGQVLANAGVAAILSLYCVLVEYTSPVVLVMIAGSFASATGDTFSSELGNLYGRNFYNILTLRKDIRGLNGVISLEGTLFGIPGSVIIALIYAIAYGWSFAFFAIAISGVAGNLCDSILGALFERKGYLSNNAVNFMNTAIAAFIALLLMQL